MHKYGVVKPNYPIHEDSSIIISTRLRHWEEQSRQQIIVICHKANCLLCIHSIMQILQIAFCSSPYFCRCLCHSIFVFNSVIQFYFSICVINPAIQFSFQFSFSSLSSDSIPYQFSILGTILWQECFLTQQAAMLSFNLI